MSCEEPIKKMAWKVGPFGGPNVGDNFFYVMSYVGDNFDDGVHSAVKQFVIFSCESRITCIQIEYDDNGSSIWSEHGFKSSQNKIDTMKLDYPDEFLTSVYGGYTRIGRHPAFISSLAFKSNKKSYGPYGQMSQTDFSIEVPGSKIVGFHGRNAGSLIAIGGYLKPIDHVQNDKSHPSKPLNHIGSSVVRTVRDPSKLLLPPENPWHTKVISEDDDKANKQISCIITGNEVNGSEGNHNGTFAIANKYKYITYYYYIGNTNAM